MRVTLRDTLHLLHRKVPSLKSYQKLMALVHLSRSEPFLLCAEVFLSLSLSLSCFRPRGPMESHPCPLRVRFSLWRSTERCYKAAQLHTGGPAKSEYGQSKFLVNLKSIRNHICQVLNCILNSKFTLPKHFLLDVYFSKLTGSGRHVVFGRTWHPMGGCWTWTLQGGIAPTVAPLLVVVSVTTPSTGSQSCWKLKWSSQPTNQRMKGSCDCCKPRPSVKQMLIHEVITWYSVATTLISALVCRGNYWSASNEP